MSLESSPKGNLTEKAKTKDQIEIEANKVKRKVRVCTYAEISEAIVQRDTFLLQKWVQLEEAQKDKQKLKDKINKILGEEIWDVTDREAIKRLHEALK
jgi:hypothetical protein